MTAQVEISEAMIEKAAQALAFAEPEWKPCPTCSMGGNGPFECGMCGGSGEIPVDNNFHVRAALEAVAPLLIAQALEPFNKALAMGFEGNMLKLPFETTDDLNAAMALLREHFAAIRTAASEV